MLALNISNPIVEQYFHGNPKEAMEALEAIATKKMLLVPSSEQAESTAQLDKLKSVLSEHKNIKAFEQIDDSVEWQRLSRDEW